MSGITLTEAKAQLTAWLDASRKTATGQSYRIESTSGLSRQLTRADAAEIRKQIDFWQRKVNQLEAQTTDAGDGRFKLATFGRQ